MKAYFVLGVAILIWSSTYSIISINVEAVGPYTLGFLRIFIATIFLFGLVHYRKRMGQVVRLFKKETGHIISAGVTGVFLLNSFQNLGIERTTSSLAAVLVNSSPIFIVVFAAIALHEKLTHKKLAGTLLGFLGILLILLQDYQSIFSLLEKKLLIGNILVTLAAISWAVYSLINKKLLRKYTFYELTFGALLVGTILMAFAVTLFEPAGFGFQLKYQHWMVVFYLGIFASGVTWLSWNYVISKIDVSRAAVYLYLIPLLAIIIGTLLLHESFTFYNFVGTILILLGVYITKKG